jgi:hypothetical protein
MKTKFNYLLVCLIAALSFTSCSSDDDDKSISAENLVGCWQASVERVWHDEGEDESTTEYDWIRVYLNADGTGRTDYKDGDSWLTYFEYTWTLNGNKMTWNYADFDLTEEYKIEKLDATTLVTYREYDYYDDDLVQHFYKESITYTKVAK